VTHAQKKESIYFCQGFFPSMMPFMDGWKVSFRPRRPLLYVYNIVVNDNNIIMYNNLPILFTGPIRLILWSSGRPPPTFKYVPTTIMLTIELGTMVQPSE